MNGNTTVKEFLETTLQEMANEGTNRVAVHVDGPPGVLTLEIGVIEIDGRPIEDYLEE